MLAFMRLRTVVVALGLSMAVGTGMAADQTPPNLVPVPDGSPAAPNGPLEGQIRITQQGEQRVEEYRVNGKVYMLKVTPKGAPSYYLLDPDGDGAFDRVSDLNSQVKVPSWLLFRF